MTINTPSLNETRKQIRSLKKQNPNAEIIIQAQSPEYNRKILENKEVDILISPELHERKDYLKQRDSGLNEILCKLAKKNNIKIGINLQPIKKLPKKQKAIVLARVRQNIQLCKRTKIPIVFIPPLTNQEKLSLITTLKGSTEQVEN